MEFITYTHDGKAVISPAALTLSKLEQEDMLELHALDGAIVVTAKNRTAVETVEVMSALMRLVSSMSADLMCSFGGDDGGVCDGDCGNCCEGCADTIPVPAEAFEDAGLLGKHLCAQVIGNTVVISEDTEHGED